MVIAGALAARREARRDTRLRLQPLLDRLFGEEAGAEHDTRVRGVRAARDRGDDDIAVMQIVIRPRNLCRAHIAGAGKPRQFSVAPPAGGGEWSAILRPAR